MAMSCCPRLGYVSGTVTWTASKPQNKLGLRFLFLVCHPPCICSCSLLATPALQNQRLNPGQFITSQAWANGVLHGCSSVLELFYQMGSAFIRKERRKGRRNEEMKGKRRDREGISLHSPIRCLQGGGMVVDYTAI